MLGNCEKMVLISSTTNEWPQTHIDDQRGLMASTTARIMEKPAGQEHHQQQQQQQQEALRCPRCDSSNTKFCYYNNYSLSQPRHFCKACKRYWTRGGTLRNVPVGGGCRKNKRVKRPVSSALEGVSPSPSPTTSSASSANPKPQIDNLPAASNHVNPLLFGLPSNPIDMNLPFPRFTSGVSSMASVSGYDLPPQPNSLGIGFSSRILTTGIDSGDFRNGFSQVKQLHEIINPSSLLSSYSFFGNSSSTNTTVAPTIASLLASKFTNGGMKDFRSAPSSFQSLANFDQDLQVVSNGDAETEAEAGSATKEVKVEADQRLSWNLPIFQNQSGDQIGVPDPSIYWNSTAMGTNWHDPANNIGSSVTSLI